VSDSPIRAVAERTSHPGGPRLGRALALIFLASVLPAASARAATPATRSMTARPVAADPGQPLAVRTPATNEQVPDTLGVPGQLPSTDEARPAPGEGSGPLDGLPIASIDLEPLNIYEPIPPGRLAGFYRIANRLHVRTRRQTLASQLLFAPGDRWSAARGRELARNLRSLDFLTPVAITPARDGDSVRVRVVTRDLWTTSPEFNFESSGGSRYGAIAFTEKNLLGLGKSLSFSYRHDPEGTAQIGSFLDPNVRGSHVRLSFLAGRGAGGAASQLQLGLPFWALDAPRSYGVSWARTTPNVTLYSQGSKVADLDENLDEASIFWGHGSYRDSVVRRFTYGFHLRDRRLGPTRQTGDMPVPAEFMGDHAERLRLRRFETQMRIWRPGFVEKLGVNQMGTIEDFDLGSSLTTTLGDAPGFFGGQSEGYVAATIQQGVSTPLGFGWIDAGLESRIRRSPHELIERVDARWIHQSLGRHTLALAARGVAGIHMDRDFEVVVGGLNGLRAYPVQAVAGRRLWRLNAEDRWQVANVFGGFFTVGAVAFTDAARAWGPGSNSDQWFVDAGTGLRFTAPQWTLGRVLRLDLAWPIQPTRDGKRQPVFSFGSSQAF
jgi:surface antigen Omp85-like protein